MSFETILDPQGLKEIKECLEKEGILVPFTPQKAYYKQHYTKLKGKTEPSSDLFGNLMSEKNDMQAGPMPQQRQEASVAISLTENLSGERGNASIVSSQDTMERSARDPSGGSWSTQVTEKKLFNISGDSEETKATARKALECFAPKRM